ncbi:xanthine dehydrogenase molybdopterin binding subunit [Gayadomonas joobiniege]|uniref:xanthine dehydrogenase molybdopterin binding subunit n=1 Tax=Gayadomonas joobiniege TaxID=1234606 RepID=UPI00035FDDA7|nr:xanthine dehydrogenase molybdopterin binding subunit [Gayadomonas joobiniege]
MRHFKINHEEIKNGTVGRSVKHESASAQVTGKAIYIDDRHQTSQILHGYPVMASVSSGTIESIDTSEALKIPAVSCILSADDIPGQNDVGPVFKGDILLAENEIFYHGQPVLLVVASSYEAARKAARKVVIKYRQTPPLLDIKMSIANQDWVRPPHSLKKGDVDTALANAANRLEGEIAIGGQEHFYLEGQVSIAEPTEEGGIFVHCSTQNPTEIQHLVAKVLKRPFNFVTVEMRRMGGGFGGKETQAAPWACLAALAADKTQQIVKIRLARSDDFRITGKRHPFYNKYEIGFTDTGIIQAADIQINGNCGYSADLSDAIVDRALFHANNAYYYPAARILGNRCRSNTVSHTAFRGFGGPQGMLTAEQIMDDIAYYCDIEPLQVRLKNLLRPGMDETPYGQKTSQFVMADMLQKLADDANYYQRKSEIAKFNQSSPIIKKGIAITPVQFGISFTVQHLNQAGALVNVYTDGSVHVNHGGTEMGQGLNTKIAQIVAQVFGIDYEQVLVNATRTDKVPNTSPTAASSGTDLNGMAALNAANTIKRRLFDYLEKTYHVDHTSIMASKNEVHFGEQKIPFSKLVEQAYLNRISLSATGYYATPEIYYDRATASGHPFFYYAHGCAVSEVEIDCLTGESTVTRTDILHDVGHSINPAIDKGQIEGAFIQGMGWLTTEDLIWHQDGQLASASPANYKIPAIGDTPAIFNLSLYDSENPETTVFRSKAVGEPPFMLAISVWCAIRHALASLTQQRFVPALNAPATPEAILTAVIEANNWNKKQGCNRD